MIKAISNNKWKITVELGKDISGTRRRKSEIFIGTKKEAERRYFEIESEFQNKPKVIHNYDITFEDYSKIFIRRYCEPNLCKKTIVEYKAMINRINSYIGSWKLNEIDSFVLDQLYTKLKTGQKIKVISNYTLLHYFNIVNLMFEQAIKFELLQINPNKKLKRPKKEVKMVTCYNPEQTKKLLNCLENENIKYNALISLAIDSGARKSELLGLEWKNVDFQNNVITIDKSLHVVNGELIEKELKNITSYRSIVITERTKNILKRYKEEQQKMFSDFSENNKVFVRKDGKSIYPTTCGKMLKEIAKRNDLPPLNFHALRHTCASLLISLGVHVKEIQDRMGHSSINVTMSTYSHVFQSNRVEVANKITDFMTN